MMTKHKESKQTWFWRYDC